MLLMLERDGAESRMVGEFADLSACTRRVRELDEQYDEHLQTRGSTDEELMSFYGGAEVYAVDSRGRRFDLTGEDDEGRLIWEEQ